MGIPIALLSRGQNPGRRLALTTASSILALAIAAPATAQTTAPGATSATDEAQEIVVTGIRGSLQRNLDIKRNAPGVVDAISAEDIGKFPDSNVAAALQRLPGVEIQRSGTRGEATGVAIRGFGGDFVDTLMDGRHISTAAGGRGVDFSTVGADFVGRLSVYKTPDVELSTSAIGGTIDVQLPKPFDRPGFHASATASGSLQSRDKSVEPTGGVLFSDTFADDTIGVLGDIAYTRHDTKTNRVFIPGWVGTHFIPCQLTPSCTVDQIKTQTPSVLGWFPQQNGAEQTSTQDDRIDGRLAVQWKPTDNLLLTIDDNFSRQRIRSQTYGYAAWFNGGELRNVKVDNNGAVTDFNQFGTPMDFNANNSRVIQQTNQVGANLKWDATEHLKFEVDGAYAKSVRNPNHNGYGDSQDIGYGGTNCDEAHGTFVSFSCGTNAQGQKIYTESTVLGANTGVRILGPSSKFLPVIHDVGPTGDVSQYFNKADIGSHVIVRGAVYNYDEVKQIRATGGWEADNFKIKFGGQYVEDHFYSENTSTFVNPVFFRYGGYGAPSGRTGALAPIPDSIYKNTVHIGSGFIPGYGGNALAPGYFIYDPYALYKAEEATGRGSTAPALDPGSILDIKEKTYAIFMKASFDADIADMPFHMNVGIRDEGTHVTAGAIGRDPILLTVPENDPTLLQATYSESKTISRKNNYNYLLPSVDLKLQVTPQLILRLDASRTLTRPSLGSLKPVINLGTLRKGSLAASGGNPYLSPYLSDNFDAGVEWYYGRNSYVSANAFLKNIDNFIVGGVSTQTINGVIDPFTGQPAKFQVNAQVNGPKGTVRGLELAVQQVFGDTGFGFQANATLVNTNRKFKKSDISGSAFAITGLANSANLVAFYDKHGFQIRGALNWRDTYLSGLGQGQGGTFGAEPVYVDAQTQIDASASWDITKQITIFVEGTNLNNSTYHTHGRFTNQPLDFWSYGRRYTAGVRFHL
jgi:TonB-dependent receptor